MNKFKSALVIVDSNEEANRVDNFLTLDMGYNVVRNLDREKRGQNRAVVVTDVTGWAFFDYVAMPYMEYDDCKFCETIEEFINYLSE